MRRLFWILTLLGLLAAPAWAQCGPGGCEGGICRQPMSRFAVPQFDQSPAVAVQPTGYQKSAVRIWNSISAREQDGGSGVWVSYEGYQWIVSCYHLFREGKGRITITNTDGTTAAAKLAAWDDVYDVSVLVAQPPTPAVCIALAEELPKAGAELQACGFGGPRAGFAVHRGRFTQFVGPGNGPADWLEIDGSTDRQGDSGGPIYAADGKLCGILFGTDGERKIHGTSVGRIRLTLDLALKALKLKRAAHKAVHKTAVVVRVSPPPPPKAGHPDKVVKKKVVKRGPQGKTVKRLLVQRGWHLAYGGTTQYEFYQAMQPPTPAVEPIPRELYPGPVFDEAELTGIKGKREPTPAQPKASPHLPWRGGSQDRDAQLERNLNRLIEMEMSRSAREAAAAANRPEPELKPIPDQPEPEPTPLGVGLTVAAALLLGIVLFYIVGKN